TGAPHPHLFLLPVALWLLLRPLLDPSPPLPALYASLGFSILALLGALYFIPLLGNTFVRASLKGRDLLKTYDDPIPESLGLVCASIYILLLILFIPFAFSDFFNSQYDQTRKLREGLVINEFPHHQFRPLYYVYMSLLSTFCTNSINILAGINGSEVSQALIIALSVILNDLLYLPWPIDFRIPLHLLGRGRELEVGGVWSAGMSYGSKVLVERHLFSLYFMLPLVGVCAGFMYHNWYPARAFPGDTLCYVTGMAFAVVGIQAHFSKTLLLLFLPQIFNFVLSCPQLFGLVPCPRHRVPRFDAETGLLYPSTASFKEHTPSRLATIVLRVFAILGFVRLTEDPKTGVISETTNLTILNVFLLRFGPMREDSLVRVLIATQVAGSVFAFVVRYGLAGLVYDGNRR
ncbi:glycosyl transferase family 4-domain-containing protein, partial [Fomitopsis serialis]|uniref:glycosyl transferase family 4-domain-containing protein n=1 Tax=Fomitopsis serialis TaxID=139415 RepID=UPI0020075B94